MERALEVLDRALKGDAGSISFLERTASIYVLDATNPGTPTTYGCWNFLNQALNEVERYESNPSQAQSHQPVCLDGHVQLLATLSRRAARRSPATDRKLIGTCLANAAQYHASPAEAQDLINLNCETRERVMGRIAAMTFDFAFHRGGGRSSHAQAHYSAFSNPIAMESLCGIVAANSVSNGPDAIRHFIVDWIVPSAENLPPFAIATVLLHVASEAMGKGAPAGTREALKSLNAPVISKVLGPLLAEAIRESDVTDQSIEQDAMVVSSGNANHRLAAMSLRALERWCTATDLGIVHLKQVGTDSNVNTIETISDALYSDADFVIDALADLLETLLQRDAKDVTALEGIVLSQPFLQGMASSETIFSTGGIIQQEENSRSDILSELASAVGLQRFRFSERQTHGDTAVCRCLARISLSTATALQPSIKSGQPLASLSGLIDLLFKGAAHPNIHVCSIAIEALSMISSSSSELSLKFLPVLQSRAIFPPSLITGPDSGPDDCGVDFHDYEVFREETLGAALVACYSCCRSFFLESCASAVEEFCSASNPSAQISYQLEAALFCFAAVSMDASKRALLMNASPASQASAAKSSFLRTGQAEEVDLADDVRRHDEQLGRCTSALAKNPLVATSNPLVLAQMCRFIGKYAGWFAGSPAQGVLDTAAELALSSISVALQPYPNNALILGEYLTVSPVAEATSALRNLLSRSPSHFATPQALVALTSGWENFYSTSDEHGLISIGDREALCSGICRVIAALPPDRWSSALSTFSQPTIVCLDVLRKKADELLSATHESGTASGDSATLTSVLTRIANEIILLSALTKSFDRAINKVRRGSNSGCRTSADGTNVQAHHHPSLMVLHKSWSCMTHISQHYISYEVIANALGEFLADAASIKDEEGSVALLQELSTMAIRAVESLIKKGDVSALAPVLGFLEEVLVNYGSMAELDAKRTALSSKDLSAANKEARDIIEEILRLTFGAVHRSILEREGQGMEQGRGEDPVEASPDPKPPEEQQSPDAISCMFAALSMCARRCPLLLVRLSSCSPGHSEEEGILTQSVRAATMTVSDKEVESARAAMIFLKSVIEMSESVSKSNSTESSTSSDVLSQIVDPAVDRAMLGIRRKLIVGLLQGSFGLFPHEVLDPAASLLHSVLRSSPLKEAESSAVEALHQEQFLLGDTARTVSLTVMGKCARGTSPPSVLMDLFSDLWQMHQTDNTGAVAGGDAVLAFTRRFQS